MQLEILLGYLSGYVDIVVEGYYIERFMNLCTSKGIFLWKIDRKRATILHARVRRQEFKRLKGVCRKTGCKMKIENKKGISFILQHYKKRKVFAILLLTIFLSIIAFSNFVWNIEVIGNDTIPSEEILQVAKESGLNIGKWKHGLNTKGVIHKLRLERDDIAWVGIEQKGTNVSIKIVEADKKPEIINEEEYCSIIAEKPAMILKMNAVNGTPLAKVGDIVKKGDVLIGGWMEGKYTGVRYLHAQGEVQAKVWYTNKQRVELVENKKEETGATENKYSVNINNFKINLYKRVSKFKNYDTIEENKKLKLFSDFYLPIEIKETIHKEYKNTQIVHTVEEAKEIAKQKARKILDEQIENRDNVLNEQVTSCEEASYVEVEVTYEVRENIGTKEKIVF